MFGIAAFSAAPFSSTAGSVYSESATIAASSTSSANAIRYAIAAAATIPATSGLACYSIRYAFAGSTIVGESSASISAVRYAFGKAQIDPASAVVASSSVILRTSATVAAESNFTSSVVYITNPSITFACQSSVIALIRKKWENEDDVTESWTPISDNSEIWTQVSDNSEIWTRTTH